MKTAEIAAAYTLLSAAKLSKMENADKFQIIRNIRATKQTAVSYEEFIQSAQERLKGEGHDTFVAQAQQWQREGDKTTLTPEERVAVNQYIADYNARVTECVKAEAEKEQPINLEHLSESAFAQLVESNDWDAQSIILLQDLLCD